MREALEIRLVCLFAAIFNFLFCVCAFFYNSFYLNDAWLRSRASFKTKRNERKNTTTKFACQSKYAENPNNCLSFFSKFTHTHNQANKRIHWSLFIWNKHFTRRGKGNYDIWTLIQSTVVFATLHSVQKKIYESFIGNIFCCLFIWVCDLKSCFFNWDEQVINWSWNFGIGQMLTHTHTRTF